LRRIRESSTDWLYVVPWAVFTGGLIWQFVSVTLPGQYASVLAGLAGLVAGAILTLFGIRWFVARWRKENPGEQWPRPFSRRAVEEGKRVVERRDASRKWRAVGSLGAFAAVLVAEGPLVVRSCVVGVFLAFCVLTPPVLWYVSRARRLTERADSL
jgi:hypothetical protein